MKTSRASGPRAAGDARLSARSAATAVKSKYAHHSAATPANATTTDSAYVVSRSRSDVPIPIATIDSPSAMITISAKRSAKWDGETRHSARATVSVPTTSMTSDASQIHAR